MLIGVIYWAVNCPICAGWDYYGLQWFDSRKAVIEWIAKEAKSQFYIKELWDATTKERLTIKVKYVPSHHCYVGAEVLDNDIKIAFLKQDPYDPKKPWIIEELAEEIEFLEENYNNVTE